MGKTKTAFVGGEVEEKLSSEEKYKQKLAKKKAEEAKAAMAEGGKENKVKKVELVESFGDAQDKPFGDAQDKPFGDAQDRQVEKVETADEAKKKKVHIRGKNYKSAKAKTDSEKLYKLPDAIKLIRSLSYAKFDETFELHIVVKKAGLNINLTLPHSFGKSKRVEVANDETIEKLKSGKIDFDVLLATAEIMPKLVMFAKLLGPKGLMPNPKNGTLIKSEKEADKFSVDQKTIKTEKEQPVIHTAVAKMSMKDGEIEDNVNAVIEAITTAQIVKCFVKSTMSPAVKLQI